RARDRGKLDREMAAFGHEKETNRKRQDNPRGTTRTGGTTVGTSALNIALSRCTGRVVPKISIVITNHNYGHFLRQAIDSALAMDYSDKEIIVSDDGSTDNSHAIIDSYGERIVAIKKENNGQCSAFNSA